MLSRALFQRLLPVMAVLALPGACSTEPPKAMTVESTQEYSATVEAIDVSTRMISLHGADDRRVTVQASPEVRNLAQVKVGDRVVARYYQALAADLHRRGDGSVGAQAPVVEDGVARAPEGGRPAGAVSTRSRQTVRITGVDTKNYIVSFYGSDGLTRSVPVRTEQAKDFIRKLKAGDEVEITYSEAVAISVEPAA